MAGHAFKNGRHQRLIRTSNSTVMHGSLNTVVTNPAVVRITGVHFGAGYLVNVDSFRHCVHQSQFDYLLELTLAAYKSPKSPFLFWWETKCTQREAGLTRQVAKRLRTQLGNESLIHNNRKGGYCLALATTSIHFCESLWGLPPQLVDCEVLNGLKVAYEQLGPAYDATDDEEVDDASDGVAPASHKTPINKRSIAVSALYRSGGADA
jgi:hypothetical protein